MPLRTFHNSAETFRIVEQLPSWMVTRTDVDSDGWQIVNALWGDGLEALKQSIDKLDSNTGLATVNPDYPRRIWRDDLQDEVPDWTKVDAFAKEMNVDGAPVEIKVADSTEEFFEGPITRFSYSPANTVSPSGTNTGTYGASGIIGIAYVEGNAATPSGGYLVNFKVPASELWSSTLYDLNWVEASGYQFANVRHDYDTNEYDEYLYVDAASPSTQLEFKPVNAQELNILDVNDIDASGFASIVPPSSYILEGKDINFINPSSLYVAEYTRETFPWPKSVTFQDRFHTNYNWVNRPTLATDTQEGEVELAFEMGLSEHTTPGALLRIDPVDLRPGNVATVRFDYPNNQRYDWSNPWQELDVHISDPVLDSLQQNAIVVKDSTGTIVPLHPYLNAEPSGSSGIGISGSSVIRDTDFQGVAPSVSDPSGWSVGSGSRIVGNIHADDTSQVMRIAQDSIIHQRPIRPLVEDTYLASITMGGVSGVASTNLNVKIDGYNDEDTWIGSVTENFIPTITDAGTDGFETHQRHIYLPLTTFALKVTLEAKTSGMYVSDFKLEPMSVFNMADYSRKYTAPFTMDVWFNAKSVYNVTGVQSLATATADTHPYAFDWAIENRRHVETNKVVEHYKPYTMLPVSDASGYITDALISGQASNFTVTVPREIVGITYAPEDRLLSNGDKRAIYGVERHQQTLTTFDTLGRSRNIQPLFSPDIRHYLNNDTVIPSGGNYLYAEPSGSQVEKPFVSYDLHADLIYGDADTVQLYREPRGIEYRDGHLYIVTAVTDQSTTYAARPSGTATFGELADSVIYRFDTWDEDRIHITPSGDSRIPLNETITNPTDMSWGPSGALLIGHSGQVHRYDPHWDYVIFDREDRVAYYRENYL